MIALIAWRRDGGAKKSSRLHNEGRFDLEPIGYKQDDGIAKVAFITECEALVSAAITLTRRWLSVTLLYKFSNLLLFLDCYDHASKQF